MGLSADLRQKHSTLWERMVSHPFVRELGDDTLPLEKFRLYFLQDYLFLKDFSVLLALGVAKAPDFEAARRLAAFLNTALQGEEALFLRTFQEWGLSPEAYTRPQPLPTALAYGDFIRRLAYEGPFAHILALLLVSEWTYWDWATRLVRAGKAPRTPAYKNWIDIHASQELGAFVGWLQTRLDALPPTPGLAEVFHTALRYEYLFWEMAYRGEQWPS